MKTKYKISVVIEDGVVAFPRPYVITAYRAEVKQGFFSEWRVLGVYDTPQGAIRRINEHAGRKI